MTTIGHRHPGESVSSLDSSFADQQRFCNSPAPLNGDGKVSLPRGCRFRDFGEAHRNITGRNISALHGTEGLVGSTSRSTSNMDMDDSLRDLTPPSIVGSSSQHGEDSSRNMSCSPKSLCSAAVPSNLEDKKSPESLIDRIFDCKDTRSCSPAIITTPVSNKKPYVLPMLRVSEGNLSPLDAADDSQGPNRSSDSHMAMTVASTDTTVTRLYTQYQTHILDPMYAGNSPPVPVIPHTVRPRETAVGRHVKAQSQTCGSPASSPRRPGLLLTAPTRESLLYPKPLRVQSIRAELKHTSLHSGVAVSATEMTTDSEEDPFRYDKDAYSIFLHPSKERDVSAALNHISGLSSHSRATLCSNEDGLPVRPISSRPPLIPKEYLVGEDPFLSGPTHARSPTPEGVDGFYDTSVIQPNWTAERGAYEVKVVLQDASRNSSIDVGHVGHRSKVGNEVPLISDRGVQSSVLSPFQSFQRGEFYRRKDIEKDKMLSSERDDWETVATTAGGLGSMRLPLPASYGLGAIGSREVKITGSSVADVSDDNSFHGVPFDEYASTDRIVHHASGHEDSEESLQIRHISGTKVPVMIPKQRMHRVNGFPQNSSRLIPHSQRSGSEAAAAFARKVSSPFRQSSGRHPRRFSPLRPLPVKLDKGKNRYEFRHNSQDSDCDPLCAAGGGGAYEFHGVSSDTGKSRSDTNNVTLSDDLSGVHDNKFFFQQCLRQSSSSQSSRGTMHSFPFPLIPLPEAARLQAVERAATRNSSDAHPERTHQQKPIRLASVFATSSTASSYRNSRLKTKSRRTMTRNFTMQSAMSSTTAGGTWTTTFPFGSTSTRYGGPSHILKSAAIRLHLDDLARRFQQRGKHGFSVGSGLTSLNSTPRLYPWDYQARRRQRTRGTDPELRAIALAESDGERHRRVHDLEHNGVPLDPEAFISLEGRHRREMWFYCMLAVSMFPFISVMVYLGKFDNGLSWFSRGEVDRLNTKQRRVILLVTVAQFVLWPVILGLVIWRTQQLANTN